VSLLLVGLSHRSAPLALREQLAVPDPAPALRRLVAADEIDEAVLVATCNRVEVVATTASEDAARRRLRSFLRYDLAERDLGPELERSLYDRVDGDAMRHVLRVASSLDSMVLGEPQILGQAKDAWRRAVACGASGPVLARLFQEAFATAKRVRTETPLAERPVSLARVAVDLAHRIFDDLAGTRVLLVGAGKMVEAAATGLGDAGVARVAVANRTPERAAELAVRCGATAHGLDELPRLLAESDLVLASIAATEPVLTPPLVDAAMRARGDRPIYVIDLGVPRNADPAIDRIARVHRYDIDDLGTLAEENARARQRARVRAEAIVEEQKRRFEGWLAAQRAVPTIRHLRERAEAIRATELERVAGRLALAPADREAVEYLTRSLVNKILHEPMTELRHSARREDGAVVVRVARRLFGLDAEPADRASGGSD
jgi:glutamyl-tRNA reductase